MLCALNVKRMFHRPSSWEREEAEELEEEQAIQKIAYNHLDLQARKEISFGLFPPAG